MKQKILYKKKKKNRKNETIVRMPEMQVISSFYQTILPEISKIGDSHGTETGGRTLLLLASFNKSQ